jgi:hypothetical protein
MTAAVGRRTTIVDLTATCGQMDDATAYASLLASRLLARADPHHGHVHRAGWRSRVDDLEHWPLTVAIDRKQLLKGVAAVSLSKRSRRWGKTIDIRRNR